MLVIPEQYSLGLRLLHPFVFADRLSSRYRVLTVLMLHSSEGLPLGASTVAILAHCIQRYIGKGRDGKSFVSDDERCWISHSG